MREYFVADLNAQGELITQQAYRYENLEQVPGAKQIIVAFTTHLWRAPEEFEMGVPRSQQVAARWSQSSRSSGILTIRHACSLSSLSLLATGIDPDADRITLGAFQRHLVRELHDTATEPAFALLEISERPLVATINFESPAEVTDRMIVALVDRCFAAAYFRFHGLV